MRRWLIATTVALFAYLAWPQPAFSQAAGLAGPRGEAPPKVEVRLLADSAAGHSADEVASGALDDRFGPYTLRQARAPGRPFWLELKTPSPFVPAGSTPVLSAEAGRHLDIRVFAVSGSNAVELPRSTRLPRFRGTQDSVFVVPGGAHPDERLLALVTPLNRDGSEFLAWNWSTLDAKLAHGTERARMIALTFGALMAMALASLLIWFLLGERMLLHYAGMIALQALYVAYVSGQGFEWPLLAQAEPLAALAWNVPAALSGAIACLFIREIAQLRRYVPRFHTAYAWFAGLFAAIAVANVADFVGLGHIVAVLGNILFLGTAVVTLVVAFVAWRRGSRSAGWFLLAWLLLEAFTIATTVELLLSNGDSTDYLQYYGLPLSMVAAAVLIALGVADQLREQRRALSDAERRAQTDPLTGVLNRRSLLEHLEAACSRAQARELPIAVLFIDLDHFKRINDSFGHPAGDACLRAVVAPIHAELRQSDVIGRYGGEEFVVILSSAGEESARLIAERIVQRVASLRVEGLDPAVRVTCSIGVAASDALRVWGEELIGRADAAVYAAKSAGRNRVETAEKDALGTEPDQAMA